MLVYSRLCAFTCKQFARRVVIFGGETGRRACVIVEAPAEVASDSALIAASAKAESAHPVLFVDEWQLKARRP